MLLIIVFILLLIFLFLLFHSRNYQKDIIAKCNSKEHPLKGLYPLIAYIRGTFLKREENLDVEGRILTYKKGAIALAGFILTLVLVVLAELKQQSEEPGIQANRIVRPSMGEGEKKVTAIFDTELTQGEIELEIQEKVLIGIQREKLLEYGEEQLTQIILGENTSFQKVMHPLNFISVIPGTGLSVRYTIHNPDFIYYDGTICFDHVEKMGSKAAVTAQILYQDTERVIDYEFVIYPKELSREEQLRQDLFELIKNQDSDTQTSDYQLLPERINNQNIQWSEKRGRKAIIIMFFGAVVTILLPVLIDRKYKEASEKRSQQMKRDYGEIIIRFQLLLASGMTTKGAWERIVTDYLRKKKMCSNEKRKSKGKEYQRAAYEEMITTKREHDVGISEGTAYENFGKRCKVLLYMRFAAILTQNLRMGSRTIAQLLEQEVNSAMEERKEQARQIGEKASTRLLIPTTGMLAVVLLIIMVPVLMKF